jgi:hypothetical protein
MSDTTNAASASSTSAAQTAVTRRTVCTDAYPDSWLRRLQSRSIRLPIRALMTAL